MLLCLKAIKFLNKKSIKTSITGLTTGLTTNRHSGEENKCKESGEHKMKAEMNHLCGALPFHNAHIGAAYHFHRQSHRTFDARIRDS